MEKKKNIKYIIAFLVLISMIVVGIKWSDFKTKAADTLESLGLGSVTLNESYEYSAVLMRKSGGSKIFELYKSSIPMFYMTENDRLVLYSNTKDYDDNVLFYTYNATTKIWEIDENNSGSLIPLNDSTKITKVNSNGETMYFFDFLKSDIKIATLDELKSDSLTDGLYLAAFGGQPTDEKYTYVDDSGRSHEVTSGDNLLNVNELTYELINANMVETDESMLNHIANNLTKENFGIKSADADNATFLDLTAVSKTQLEGACLPSAVTVDTYNATVTWDNLELKGVYGLTAGTNINDSGYVGKVTLNPTKTGFIVSDTDKDLKYDVQATITVGTEKPVVKTVSFIYSAVGGNYKVINELDGENYTISYADYEVEAETGTKTTVYVPEAGAVIKVTTEDAKLATGSEKLSLADIDTSIDAAISEYGTPIAQTGVRELDPTNTKFVNSYKKSDASGSVTGFSTDEYGYILTDIDGNNEKVIKFVKTEVDSSIDGDIGGSTSSNTEAVVKFTLNEGDNKALTLDKEKITNILSSLRVNKITKVIVEDGFTKIDTVDGNDENSFKQIFPLLKEIELPSTLTDIGQEAIIGLYTDCSDIYVGNWTTQQGKSEIQKAIEETVASSYEGDTATIHNGKLTVDISASFVDVLKSTGTKATVYQSKSNEADIVLRISGTGSTFGLVDAIQSYTNKNKVIELIIDSGITEIYNGTFNGLSSLTNVTVGSDCTLIKSGAFSACTSISDFVFDGVTNIDSGAFGTFVGLNLKDNSKEPTSSSDFDTTIYTTTDVAASDESSYTANDITAFLTNGASLEVTTEYSKTPNYTLNAYSAYTLGLNKTSTDSGYIKQDSTNKFTAYDIFVNEYNTFLNNEEYDNSLEISEDTINISETTSVITAGTGALKDATNVDAIGEMSDYVKVVKSADNKLQLLVNADEITRLRTLVNDDYKEAFNSISIAVALQNEYGETKTVNLNINLNVEMYPSENGVKTFTVDYYPLETGTISYVSAVSGQYSKLPTALRYLNIKSAFATIVNYSSYQLLIYSSAMPTYSGSSLVFDTNVDFEIYKHSTENGWTYFNYLKAVSEAKIDLPSVAGASAIDYVSYNLLAKNGNSIVIPACTQVAGIIKTKAIKFPRLPEDITNKTYKYILAKNSIDFYAIGSDVQLKADSIGERMVYPSTQSMSVYALTQNTWVDCDADAIQINNFLPEYASVFESNLLYMDDSSSNFDAGSIPTSYGDVDYYRFIPDFTATNGFDYMIFSMGYGFQAIEYRDGTLITEENGLFKFSGTSADIRIRTYGYEWGDSLPLSSSELAGGKVKVAGLINSLVYSNKNIRDTSDNVIFNTVFSASTIVDATFTSGDFECKKPTGLIGKDLTENSTTSGSTTTTNYTTYYMTYDEDEQTFLYYVFDTALIFDSSRPEGENNVYISLSGEDVKKCYVYKYNKVTNEWEKADSSPIEYRNSTYYYDAEHNKIYGESQIVGHYENEETNTKFVEGSDIYSYYHLDENGVPTLNNMEESFDYYDEDGNVIEIKTGEDDLDPTHVDISKYDVYADDTTSTYHFGPVESIAYDRNFNIKKGNNTIEIFYTKEGTIVAEDDPNLSVETKSDGAIIGNKIYTYNGEVIKTNEFYYDSEGLKRNDDINNVTHYNGHYSFDTKTVVAGVQQYYGIETDGVLKEVYLYEEWLDSTGNRKCTYTGTTKEKANQTYVSTSDYVHYKEVFTGYYALTGTDTYEFVAGVNTKDGTDTIYIEDYANIKWHNKDMEGKYGDIQYAQNKTFYGETMVGEITDAGYNGFLDGEQLIDKETQAYVQTVNDLGSYWVSVYSSLTNIYDPSTNANYLGVIAPSKEETVGLYIPMYNALYKIIEGDLSSGSVAFDLIESEYSTLKDYRHYGDIWYEETTEVDDKIAPEIKNVYVVNKDIKIVAEDVSEYEIASDGGYYYGRELTAKDFGSNIYELSNYEEYNNASDKSSFKIEPKPDTSFVDCEAKDHEMALKFPGYQINKYGVVKSPSGVYGYFRLTSGTATTDGTISFVAGNVTDNRYITNSIYTYQEKDASGNVTGVKKPGYYTDEALTPEDMLAIPEDKDDENYYYKLAENIDENLYMEVSKAVMDKFYSEETTLAVIEGDVFTHYFTLKEGLYIGEDGYVYEKSADGTDTKVIKSYYNDDLNIVNCDSSGIESYFVQFLEDATYSKDITGTLYNQRDENGYATGTFTTTTSNSFLAGEMLRTTDSTILCPENRTLLSFYVVDGAGNRSAIVTNDGIRIEEETDNEYLYGEHTEAIDKEIEDAINVATTDTVSPKIDCVYIYKGKIWMIATDRAGTNVIPVGFNTDTWYSSSFKYNSFANSSDRVLTSFEYLTDTFETSVINEGVTLESLVGQKLYQRGFGFDLLKDTNGNIQSASISITAVDANNNETGKEDLTEVVTLNIDASSKGIIYGSTTNQAIIDMLDKEASGEESVQDEVFPVITSIYVLNGTLYVNATDNLGIADAGYGFQWYSESSWASDTVGFSDPYAKNGVSFKQNQAITKGQTIYENIGQMDVTIPCSLYVYVVDAYGNTVRRLVNISSDNTLIYGTAPDDVKDQIGEGDVTDTNTAPVITAVYTYNGYIYVEGYDEGGLATYCYGFSPEDNMIIKTSYSGLDANNNAVNIVAGKIVQAGTTIYKTRNYQELTIPMYFTVSLKDNQGLETKMTLYINKDNTYFYGEEIEDGDDKGTVEDGSVTPGDIFEGLDWGVYDYVVEVLDYNTEKVVYRIKVDEAEEIQLPRLQDSTQYKLKQSAVRETDGSEFTSQMMEFNSGDKTIPIITKVWYSKSRVYVSAYDEGGLADKPYNFYIVGARNQSEEDFVTANNVKVVSGDEVKITVKDNAGNTNHVSVEVNANTDGIMYECLNPKEAVYVKAGETKTLSYWLAYIKSQYDINVEHVILTAADKDSPQWTDNEDGTVTLNFDNNAVLSFYDRTKNIYYALRLKTINSGKSYRSIIVQKTSETDLALAFKNKLLETFGTYDGLNWAASGDAIERDGSMIVAVKNGIGKVTVVKDGQVLTLYVLVTDDIAGVSSSCDFSKENFSYTYLVGDTFSLSSALRLEKSIENEYIVLEESSNGLRRDGDTIQTLSTGVKTLSLIDVANDALGEVKFEVIEVNPYIATFTDIIGSNARADIEYLTERGIIAAYPDDKYKPANKMTTKELLTMINRIKLVYDPDFENDKVIKDINLSEKDFDYYASMNVLINMSEDEVNSAIGEFSLNKAVTFYDMVRVISATLLYDEYHTEEGVEAPDGLTDAESAAVHLVSIGIIDKEDTMNGTREVTRAEIAYLLTKTIKFIEL